MECVQDARIAADWPPGIHCFVFQLFAYGTVPQPLTFLEGGTLLLLALSGISYSCCFFLLLRKIVKLDGC